VPYGDGNRDQWSARIAEWAAVGATHVGFNTMGAGFQSPQEHLDALRQFAEGMGVRA
jgi:hypothetical protein